MNGDIIGKRFGGLVVLRRVEDKISPKGYKKPQYVCACDCGNTKVVVKGNLLTGNTTSCGCYKKELDHKRFLKHGYAENPDKLYQKWLSMRDRCFNPKATSYKNYGARGIRVCTEWDNYISFREWAFANGYKDGLTIDRIDVDGDYEPNNCRFATMKEQNNNRRTTNFHTYNGKTQSEMKWAEEYGISYGALKTRLKYGWSFEDALNTPVKPFEHLVEYEGETHNIKQWARLRGISSDALSGRLERGWSFEDAINTPVLESPFRTELIECRGETHKLSEWSKIVGIKYGTLKSRIKRGWDIEKVLFEPLAVNNREYISREE